MDMDLVRVLKSISDDTRIRIINLLKHESLCVCEIEYILNISQSNASRHLSKLVYTNLVVFKKEAKFVYYSLNKTNFKLFEGLFLDFENEEILKKDIESLNKYKASKITCKDFIKGVE